MSWLETLRAGFSGGPVYEVGGYEVDDAAIVASGNIAPTPLTQITTNSSSWGEYFTNLQGLPQLTETSAQQISAVYACVNLIAGAISALPLNLYRRSPDGERAQLHNDDLWWLLNEEMLPRWGATNGWEFIVMNLLFHGNGYAIIRRHPITAMPTGLEPVHRQQVTVVPTPDRTRLIYAVANDMRVPGSTRGFEVYDQDDMIDIAGFGFDGFYGMSPLKYHLTMAGGIASATQEYAARFFTNGARPDVVISTDQAISPEKAGEIQQSWVERYTGLANSHKPAVMGLGAKVVPLTMSAEDAQLLATRKFQIEEIARIYGVPPFMIGHLEKTTSWGSGVETMGTGFVRFTLRQHLGKIEKEINRKFFHTKSRFVEFDTFQLESADMAALFSSFATALGTGGGQAFMTTDEVRQKLNLKRTIGGDTLPTGTSNAQEPTAQPAGA